MESVRLQNMYMPLFEYACRGCSHHFEFLTRSGQEPKCPNCAGEELEKQLSVFAVSAADPSGDRLDTAPGACGSCGDPRGPGACSLN